MPGTSPSLCNCEYMEAAKRLRLDVAVKALRFMLVTLCLGRLCPTDSATEWQWLLRVAVAAAATQCTVQQPAALSALSAVLQLCHNHAACVLASACLCARGTTVSTMLCWGSDCHVARGTELCVHTHASDAYGDCATAGGWVQKTATVGVPHT